MEHPAESTRNAKYAFSSFVLVLLIAAPGVVPAASDWAVVGTVDVAYKDLELQPPQGGPPFSSILTTINPGIAVAYKQVYLNVNYDHSAGSTETTQLDDGLPQTVSMSRSDTVLTLGYRIVDSIGIFAGYLFGEIGAHLTGETDKGGVVFFTQDTRYQTRGPFAGLSLSYTFADHGTIATSVAYASLDGELSQTLHYGGTVKSSEYQHFNFSVTGLNYSLVWTGPLTSSTSYRVGAKYTNYEGERDFPIGEKYTTFFFGITSVF